MEEEEEEEMKKTTPPHPQLYLCPVSKCNHQRDQPWLQLSKSRQVLCGQPSVFISCTDFTKKAASGEGEGWEGKRENMLDKD